MRGKVGRLEGQAVTRREALQMGAATLAATVFPTVQPSNRPTVQPPNRLKQSVSRWPFKSITLPEFWRDCKGMGLSAIDLLAPEEWPVVRDCGLVCSMGYAVIRDDFIPRGFNDPANHDFLVGELERALPLAAAQGVPNRIAMFGNRQGRTDAQGIEQWATGVRRSAPPAEPPGVRLCAEP